MFHNLLNDLCYKPISYKNDLIRSVMMHFWMTLWIW